MSTVGERIKDQRLLNKLTMQEVANRLNVTRTTIFKYENGDIKNIPIPTIKQLADVFGCTPQYLSGLELLPTETTDELQTLTYACERLTTSERRELLRFMRYWYPNVFQQ